jgi:uncharacterized protein YceK
MNSLFPQGKPMMKSLKLVILAIIIPPLVGCGTITNLTGGFKYPEGDARIYGGVLTDLEAIDALCDAGTSHQSTGSPYLLFIIVPLALGEAVLTFTCDTLTLPYTMYKAHQRATCKEEGDVPSPPTASHNCEVDQKLDK